MTQPDAVEALSAAIRADIDAVWARITAEQTRLLRDWPTLPRPLRRRRLRQLEQMVLELADQADTIAAGNITNTLRGAYEIGATATAVTLTVAPSITGVDYDAIRILAADTMSDLLAATQHVRESTKTLVRTMTRDHIRSKLYTGETAVQAADDLAKALRGKGIEAVRYANGRSVGLSTYTEMVVRTKTAQAYQEGGFNQGESLDIGYWELHDGPGCGLTAHNDPQKADGMIVTLEVAREWPLSHPNCVMPETVSGFYGGVEQLVRARYDGPAYTLTWRTPSGLHSATVGPHHPVLTPRGWVRAHLIHEGDQLVNDTHAPCPVPGDRGEADLKQVPSTIEQSFEALRALGRYTRVAATGDDLHGDAVFSDGEIDVVDIDRMLLGEGDSTFLEHPLEGDLVWADVVPIDEVRAGSQEQLVTGPRFATDCVVSVGGTSGSLLGGRVHCRDTVALGDCTSEAVPPESASDGCRVESCAARYLGGGESLGDVEVDEGFERDAHCGHRFHLAEIVSVEVDRFCGWVYDATTAGGAFTANGAVVKNCRRASSPRPDIETAEEAANATRTPTENYERNQQIAAAYWAENELQQTRRAVARRTRSLNLREGARTSVQQRHDAIINRSATRAARRSAPSA